MPRERPRCVEEIQQSATFVESHSSGQTRAPSILCQQNYQLRQAAAAAELVSKFSHEIKINTDYSCRSIKRVIMKITKRILHHINTL